MEVEEELKTKLNDKRNKKNGRNYDEIKELLEKLRKQKPLTRKLMLSLFNGEKQRLNYLRQKLNYGFVIVGYRDIKDRIWRKWKSDIIEYKFYNNDERLKKIPKVEIKNIRLGHFGNFRTEHRNEKIESFKPIDKEQIAREKAEQEKAKARTRELLDKAKQERQKESEVYNDEKDKLNEVLFYDFVRHY